VGMRGLDQPAVRRLDRGEVGVAVELKRGERAHFVAAAAAVAGSRPLPLRRLAEALGAGFLLGGAARGFLGGEAREIVPVPVIFGGMRLAEQPALAAVRGLRRWPIADLGAAFAVAQAQPGRPAALVAIGPPARESPVVRSLLLRHSNPSNPSLRGAQRRSNPASPPPGSGVAMTAVAPEGL